MKKPGAAKRRKGIEHEPRRSKEDHTNDARIIQSGSAVVQVNQVETRTLQVLQYS